MDEELPVSLPPLLISLIQEGRWRQPSDEVIRAVIRVLPGPVDFYLTEAAIRSATSGQRSLRSDRFLKIFRLARALPGSPAPDLPWIDTDLAIVIAGDRLPGDDVSVVLDYRSDLFDPRVVASEWIRGDPSGCYWREVSPSFSDFVNRLGL